MAQQVQVTLVSPSGIPIRALVESALRSELKMIELSLGRTERNLQAFVDYTESWATCHSERPAGAKSP